MGKPKGSLSSSYSQLQIYDDGDRTITAWQSGEEADHQWDTFLEHSLHGQYQQTSMWSRLKKLDGWEVIRIVFTEKESIIGGFQILCRHKRYFGKMGLLLKGPVFESGRTDIEKFAIDMIKMATSANRINAILVQPPDDCPELPKRLKVSGFLPNYIDYAIKEATVVINVTRSLDEIFKNLKHAKRTNINRASKKGVIVREGSEEELSIFFEHMLESCKRQGVSPNPSNIEYLKNMWRLFYPSGHLKLFVAEVEHEMVSSIVAIPFGRSLNLWKFGWSGKYGNYRPNDMLYWKIFEWAKEHGFYNVDLVVISGRSASSMLQDGKRSQEITKTWSFFKLDFGGKIVMLPEGCIYVKNPMTRFMYKTGMPFVKKFSLLKKGFLQGLT